MNTTNKQEDRSAWSRLRAAVRYELEDFLCYDGRIDWYGMSLTAMPGVVAGILLGITIEREGDLLIAADPVLGIAITVTLLGVGALLSCGGVGLTVVAVALIINVMDSRAAGKERIRALRYNTKYLRRSVVGGRVPLDMNEMVTHDLHRRRTITLADDAGPYERYLWRRWQRQRERTRTALALSWSQDLTTAISELESNLFQDDEVYWGTFYPNETEVAWYLFRQPTNVAVRRILAEYVPTEVDDLSGNLRFRRGLVYTPRWVYDLAAFGERHAHVQVTYPMFQPSYRSSKVVGDECVPIGNVDRETVEKLYDPESDGPFRSLTETVETARRL
jgi:hypothetical protein